MTELSLGARLKARLEKEQADKVAVLEREAREKGQKALQELALVQQFFDNARTAIEQDIRAEVAVRRIVLGRGNYMEVYSLLQAYNWNNLKAVIDQVRHPFYPVWERFASWADENDLKVGWRNEHDGGGMESWNVLTVCPKMS